MKLVIEVSDQEAILLPGFFFATVTKQARKAFSLLMRAVCNVLENTLNYLPRPNGRKSTKSKRNPKLSFGTFAEENQGEDGGERGGGGGCA